MNAVQESVDREHVNSSFECCTSFIVVVIAALLPSKRRGRRITMLYQGSY